VKPLGLPPDKIIDKLPPPPFISGGVPPTFCGRRLVKVEERPPV